MPQIFELLIQRFLVFPYIVKEDTLHLSLCLIPVLSPDPVCTSYEDSTFEFEFFDRLSYAGPGFSKRFDCESSLRRIATEEGEEI